MLGHWPPVPLRPRTRSHWPVRVSARSAGVDPSAAGVARGHALSRLPRIMMIQARCSNNPSRPFRVGRGGRDPASKPAQGGPKT